MVDLELAHPALQNTMLARVAQGQSVDSLHDPLDDEMPLFAASDHDAQDARRDLMGLLQTLPDKQRRPIECVKIDGLSVAETARLTGLSESAVKVGIHRGLKSLAARLGHSYSATRSKA